MMFILIRRFRQAQIRIELTSSPYSFIVKLLFSNQRFIFVNLFRSRNKKFTIISQYIFSKLRRFSCTKLVINTKKYLNLSNPWRKLTVRSWLRFGPSISQDVHPYQKVWTSFSSTVLKFTSRPQNKVHRRPTSWFFLWFSYDFGVTRNSSSNADAMGLRGIHPTDIIQNGGRPGGNASRTRTG
jgi:hypothetical protein